METIDIAGILAQFEIEGGVKEVKPLGNGLINDTYHVVTDGDAPDYVLQRINNAIFQDVDLLQHNIEVVTAHIRRKLEASGSDDIDRRVLQFVRTRSGKTYYRDETDRYWRIMVYIPDTITREAITPESAHDCGKAFGNFEKMLVDVPEPLGETIPDFHNMELRMSQLREAVKNDAEGRLAEVRDIFYEWECDADEMCQAERYWRVMVYIPDTVTREAVTPESVYDCGKAFGNFEKMLVDVPEQMGETIPDFHNMELRMQQLREAVEKDAAGRLAEVQDIVEELERDAEEMCQAERLYREGSLPKRICHCDTKVNNMLFDQDGQVRCVIDLDTVMPSFIFSDYGDFLRTGANFTAEDDPDLSRVGFNEATFKSFTTGYLESAREFLTPIEVELLPYAVALFPFMQCVRFLADYLNGDTYYKIKYPAHNLDRTRNQLALYHDVRRHDQMMSDFIHNLLNQTTRTT